MRVMSIDAFGGPENLRARELPRPRAGRGELLVRVVAAGINRVDSLIREGRLQDRLPHAFPLVPGWDVAGVVEELGDSTSRFRKGDRVWACARKPVVQWGCYADYATIDEANCALMPSKMLYEEAAGVPLAGLTAYQCLFGRPGVGAGCKVLVLGASSGTGHLAVQLARNAGAEVHGTAEARHNSVLFGLGVASAIDPTREPVAAAAARLCPDGFDLVLDAAGGDLLPSAHDLVRPGGRLVSALEEPDAAGAKNRGITAHFVFAEPNSEQLGLLSGMVDRKQLSCHVERIYALADAAEAQRHLDGGTVCGKLVLNL